MSSSETFLDAEELTTLTGRKTKRKQVEALRAMHIPFFVNAIGAPVVCRAAIIGNMEKTREADTSWTPSLR